MWLFKCLKDKTRCVSSGILKTGWFPTFTGTGTFDDISAKPQRSTQPRRTYQNPWERQVSCHLGGFRCARKKRIHQSIGFHHIWLIFHMVNVGKLFTNPINPIGPSSNSTYIPYKCNCEQLENRRPSLLSLAGRDLLILLIGSKIQRSPVEGKVVFPIIDKVYMPGGAGLLLSIVCIGEWLYTISRLRKNLQAPKVLRVYQPNSCLFFRRLLLVYSFEVKTAA